MGAVESSCRGCVREQCVRVQGLTQEAVGPHLQEARRPSCLQPSHVDAILASLPPEQQQELDSPGFCQSCTEAFKGFDRNCTGLLEGRELTEAVQDALPQNFQRRLHCDDVTALALAFDVDLDGKISLEEFSKFCQWTVAMEFHGFFSGTAPLAQVAEVGRWAKPARRLLLVSEFLDPERQLRTLAQPSVRCVYYHPDGLTLDEFSAQLESAAYIRRKRGYTFESVALANHGPDEDGLWHVCADCPVPLQSAHEAWEMLMPLFHALADMVAGPASPGHVDLLACSFAATPGGLDCLAMIEREVKVRFAASTDATGNMAHGGDWVLERGGRDVGPIYFDEERLGEFHKLMRPASKRRNEAKCGIKVVEGIVERPMTRDSTNKVILQQYQRQLSLDAKDPLVNLHAALHTVGGLVEMSGATMKDGLRGGLMGDPANLAKKYEQEARFSPVHAADPRMKAHRAAPPRRFRGRSGRDPLGRRCGPVSVIAAGPEEFPSAQVGYQAHALRQAFRR